MALLREVLHDLFGMFVADVGLTLAALAVVALAWALAAGNEAAPLVSGAVLLLGSVSVLIGAVWRAARST